MVAFYLSVIEKMKPRDRSWIKVFIYSQLLIPIIGITNNILDANYMYLSEAPIAKNPFIITTKWPWYIIGIDIAALLHFYLIELNLLQKNNGNLN